MTATMFMPLDDLRLPDPQPAIEADLTESMVGRQSSLGTGVECQCLLSAVGRCPTQLMPAPS
jgi:hypothetical protein